MGTIGLYDYDMQKYIHVPFNLELMKLATYYKKKREIISLSPLLVPEKYSMFFFRKDYDDGVYSKKFTKYATEDNFHYGGLAFSNGIYAPLEEDIERCKPDVYIYDRYKDVFCNNLINKRTFNTMQRAEHLRLSLDGKTIWKDFEKQIQITSKTFTLFFHDYNLNEISDSFEAITDLINTMTKQVGGRRIAMKFPVQVNNGKDLLKWSSINCSAKNFSLQYNGVMDDGLFVEFIDKEMRSVSRQMDYVITASSYDENDFIEHHLTQIFRQVIYSRSKRVPILLKYEDNFFKDKRWEKAIDLISCFANSGFGIEKDLYNRSIKYDSMFKFAKSLKEKPIYKIHKFSRQDARDVFQFVRERHYETFKDFYECHNVQLKGGKLEYE